MATTVTTIGDDEIGGGGGGGGPATQITETSGPDTLAIADILDQGLLFRDGLDVKSIPLSSVSVAQDQVFYVGKHGDDLNSGDSPEQAFLTIGAALAAAGAVALNTNLVSVVVCDSGTYAENLTVPPFVSLFAPGIHLTPPEGTGITCTHSCAIDVGRITLTGASTGILRTGAVPDPTLNTSTAARIRLGSAWNDSTDACIFFFNDFTGVSCYFQAGVLKPGVGCTAVVDSGNTTVDIGEIVTTSGGIGGVGVGAWTGCTLSGRIGAIRTATPGGLSDIAVFVDGGGVADLDIGSVDMDGEFYNVAAGGILRAYVSNLISGNKTVDPAGSAKVVYAANVIADGLLETFNDDELAMGDIIDQEILWRDGAVIKSRTAASIATPPTSRIDHLYVAKHGDDLNTGLNPDAAFLTIGAALTAAALLTPADGNRVNVEVLDSGIYAEAITVPAFVNLIAPTATLAPAAGTALSLTYGSLIDLGYIDSANNADAISKSGTQPSDNTATDPLVKVGMITMTGSGTALMNTANGVYSPVKFVVGSILVGSGSAVGKVGTNNGDIEVDIGSIVLATNGRGLHSATAAQKLFGRVGKIILQPAATGTLAISGVSGSIDLNVNYINTATVFDLTSPCIANVFLNEKSATTFQTGTGTAYEVRPDGIERSGLAATPVSVFTLSNSTAATGGVPQQVSPALQLNAQVYDTGTTTSKVAECRIYGNGDSANPARSNPKLDIRVGGSGGWTNIVQFNRQADSQDHVYIGTQVRVAGAVGSGASMGSGVFLQAGTNWASAGLSNNNYSLYGGASVDTEIAFISQGKTNTAGYLFYFIGTQQSSTTPHSTAVHMAFGYKTAGNTKHDFCNWMQNGDMMFGARTTGDKAELKTLTELTTINAAASTDTAIQIPANALVYAVTARVTVTVTCTATIDVGVAGATTRYANAISRVAGTVNTAGATSDGWRYYSSATAITITPNDVPSDNTGRVRIVIRYLSVTASTS